MNYAQPAAPASGDRFDPKNHPEWANALFLIFPTKVNDAKQWDPKYEAAETVSADMVILDRTGPDGMPVKLDDTMIFGQLLVAQMKQNLRESANPVVLGRLGKKLTPNGFEAWTLNPFQEGVDDLLADRYQAQFPRNAVAQPGGQSPTPPFGAPDQWSVPPPGGGQWGAAPPAAAPAAQGWGAPPPAAAPAAQQWGAPAAPVMPPAPPAEVWPDGLREFLASKGITDTSTMTVDAARNLAGTF